MRRVLVANRGEVAVRVVRACHALGLQAVVAYSEADRDSMPVAMADRAVCVGPAPAARSYLSVPAMTSAALVTGCDAVHPGYGFLAESAEFAAAVESAGLVFVGPSPAVLRLTGDKDAARQAAQAAGLAVLPGAPAVDDMTALSVDDLRYPLLLKAAAGGGGRGIRLVRGPDELRAVFPVASAEAQAAFGDGRLYAETFVERARHIEVQVLADANGAVVHLGDRECTVQRRHQKVVEEAPSSLTDDQRRQVCGWAVALCRHIGYRGAGTVEFVHDAATKDTWFIEMNARVQVEHGVTELVSGVDIVATQLLVAAGEHLPFRQEDVRIDGHAVEWRLTCESLAAGLLPVPGTITEWRPPVHPHVRVDSHAFAGYGVPPFYDSLLAKVMAHGGSRAEAIARLRAALRDFRVAGVPTTADLADVVLNHPDYLNDAVHTRWLDAIVSERTGR